MNEVNHLKAEIHKLKRSYSIVEVKNGIVVVISLGHLIGLDTNIGLIVVVSINQKVVNVGTIWAIISIIFKINKIVYKNVNHFVFDEANEGNLSMIMAINQQRDLQQWIVIHCKL